MGFCDLSCVTAFRPAKYQTIRMGLRWYLRCRYRTFSTISVGIWLAGFFGIGLALIRTASPYFW